MANTLHAILNGASLYANPHVLRSAGTRLCLISPPVTESNYFQTLCDPHAAAKEVLDLQVYGPDGLGKTAMGGHPRRQALSSTLGMAGQQTAFIFELPGQNSPDLNRFQSEYLA